MDRGIKTINIKAMLVYSGMALGFALFLMYLDGLDPIGFSELCVSLAFPAGMLLFFLAASSGGELTMTEDGENLVCRFKSREFLFPGKVQEVTLPKGENYTLEYTRGRSYVNEFMIDNGSEYITIRVDKCNFIFKRQIIEFFYQYSSEVETEGTSSHYTWEFKAETEIEQETIAKYKRKNVIARGILIMLIVITVGGYGGYKWNENRIDRETEEFYQNAKKIKGLIEESDESEIASFLEDELT